MDMTKSDPSLSVNVVQGDAYSRSLCIALYSGAVPWTIPDGVTVAVRYSKSDHTKGYYDTLPDGSSAWSVDDNILTVRLAPQMLTVPGKVIAQIEFVLGAHILSTFSLTVHVEPNPAAGVLKSEDYFNWLQWFQEQTDEHVSQIQKSILSANLAAQSAVQASEEAAASALKAESIAAGISVIVARNEAYTKQESDVRYSPSIFEVKTGTVLTLSDSASASFQLVKLFGKTTQNGTPTPEAPIPLESVGESVTVRVGTSKTDPNPQVATFSAPNVFSGIPVTSNGNYTDENGQQWVCDEVDFEKGVYIQRIFRKIIDGSVSFTSYNPAQWVTNAVGYYRKTGAELNKGGYAVMSDSLPKTGLGNLMDSRGIICHPTLDGFIYISLPFELLGITATTDANVGLAAMTAYFDQHPMTLLYELATPIETALSAEQLAQYTNSDLNTHYPNTTIFNDEGTGMEVKYVADTKLYIDKKFDQLAQAILS